MRRAATCGVVAVALLVGSAATARTIPKKRADDHVVGKELWERSCWPCHGKENDGRGPAAAAIPGGVPDLRNTVTPDRYGELIDVILDGKNDMPAFRAEMDRHQARRILVYLERVDEKARDKAASPEERVEEELEEPPTKE